MMLHAYAIRDTKADAFNTPFFFTTQGQALRAFSDLANDKNSLVGMHPEDYNLYDIGTFDTNSGKLLGNEGTYLATGSDFINLNATPLQRIG